MKPFSPRQWLATATDTWAQARVARHASPEAHLAGLTGSSPRAHVNDDVTTVAGGRARGGAAEIWHAGPPRLHLKDLLDEGYRMDMLARRGAAGKHAGGEVPRRWRTTEVAPEFYGERGSASMSRGFARLP